MSPLVRFITAIDRLSLVVGYAASVCVLLACLVSAGNAVIRYLFSMSSNGWLEVQWYMFAGTVMLGAAHTLRKNEHVRVDLVYGMVSERTRDWIDVFGIVVFLLPMSFILAFETWGFFIEAWRIGEVSQNAGGLTRWPVKLLLPVGFLLLSLQGLAELAKRILDLRGAAHLQEAYERPMQ